MSLETASCGCVRGAFSGALVVGFLGATAALAQNPCNSSIECASVALAAAQEAREAAAGAIPVGAVVGFVSGSCPNENWIPYQPAANAYLMGTVVANEVGSVGGSSTVSLEVPNLPPHSHVFGKSLGITVAGLGANRMIWSLQQPPGPAYVNESTQETGSGDPITIQPPFVKLLFCERVQ